VFKNILVPTDGSALSQSAAQTAVALAKATGARIIAFHVVPNSEFSVGPACMNQERVTKIAGAILDHVRSLANCAGVACDTHYVEGHSAANAIVKAAERYDCDCIVMGSHGHRGLKDFLLGSETQRVLISAKVPVMTISIDSTARLPAQGRQRENVLHLS
jgi:nucleotide-binding universal stress UspA family protein